MGIEIIPIPLHYLTTVNSYLIKSAKGDFILIDTGFPPSRKQLQIALDQAGCHPGNLKLILLTHGDYDHMGNARFIREQYGAVIGMHSLDAGMAERGDMTWNRKSRSALIGKIARLVVRFTQAERFTPDVILQDGFDLSVYGVSAHVLHLPGHSAGHVGILTEEGDLFCGDLFTNTDQPAISVIMDDVPTARQSVDRLKGLKVRMVYPGHGKPFLFEEFVKLDERSVVFVNK